MGETFVELLPEFGVYLTYALERPTEANLCRVAVHATSDIIRSINHHFSKFMESILPLIFTILKVNFVYLFRTLLLKDR